MLDFNQLERNKIMVLIYWSTPLFERFYQAGFSRLIIKRNPTIINVLADKPKHRLRMVIKSN